MPLEATFAGSDKVDNLLEDFGAPAPWAQIVLMSGAKLRNEGGKVSMTWRGFKRSIGCHDIEQAKEILAALIAADFLHGLEADGVDFSVLVTDWELWNTGRAAVRKAWTRGNTPPGQPVTSGDQVGTNGDSVTLEEKRVEEKKKILVREDVELLCSLLAELVEQNGSKPPPVTDRWRAECRLLLDRDHRPQAEVEAVLRWSQANSFWKANVLSMPKLREKYDRLRLQMEAETEPKKDSRAAKVYDLRTTCRDCNRNLAQAERSTGRCDACFEAYSERVLGEDGAA